MNARNPALPLPTTARRAPPAAMRRGTRLALDLLDRMEGGALSLELAASPAVTLGRGEVTTRMTVHDEGVFDDTLAQGDIGFGEAYVDGRWDSPDLGGLLTLLASNRRQLERAIRGRALALAGHRLRHWLRRNSRAGARRNISRHYDLGNDFYRLWLDPSMSYSSALFESPQDTLEQAQRRKLHALLDGIGLRPGQHLLEIGCGWGGLAEVAVRDYGARVTGITLSQEQLHYCRERARRGGWSGQASFELRDYRDLETRPERGYDHIASVEMIEAVGERYWPAYFSTLRRLLPADGRVGLQAITIADGLFPRYRRGTDFIQRHVFPGGMLPCPSALQREAGRAGLSAIADRAFGPSYAVTLQRWRARVDQRAEEILALGFDDRFLRLWRFYLAYCEAGFRAGDLDVHQLILGRR